MTRARDAVAKAEKAVVKAAVAVWTFMPYSECAEVDALIKSVRTLHAARSAARRAKKGKKR